MNYYQFENQINCLKEFFEEQEKLKNVLKVISPSGTCVCEFGNKFIDDYIRLLETAVKDEDGWISWFVFDNDFGKKELLIKINNKDHIINGTKPFYNLIFSDKNN